MGLRFCTFNNPSGEGAGAGPWNTHGVARPSCYHIYICLFSVFVSRLDCKLCDSQDFICLYHIPE